MAKTIKAVPKLEKESYKDRLKMGKMVSSGRRRPPGNPGLLWALV